LAPGRPAWLPSRRFPLDPQAEIALVCDEPAYARMVLPYYLQGRIEEGAVRTADAGWFEDRGVQVHLARRVERL
jgi:NAD(P)H-nitrite reductase large subunit